MAAEICVLKRALKMSGHADVRMQQRGVTPRMVQIALVYGDQTWSHGSVCHRITERVLCGTPFAAEADRLRGLCVVLGRDGTVITVKWDHRLCRPGPLRRSNWARWREVETGHRSKRAACRESAVPLCLALAA